MKKSIVLIVLVLLVCGLSNITTGQLFSPLAPFITTVPGVAKQQNKSPGAYVWDLNAVDVNPGDTFTFSLSGPGSENFQVVQKYDSHNQLKTYLAVKEQLSENTIYEFTVTAKDNTGLSSSETMTVITIPY